MASCKTVTDGFLSATDSSNNLRAALKVEWKQNGCNCMWRRCAFLVAIRLQCPNCKYNICAVCRSGGERERERGTPIIALSHSNLCTLRTIIMKCKHNELFLCVRPFVSTARTLFHRCKRWMKIRWLNLQLVYLCCCGTGAF